MIDKAINFLGAKLKSVIEIPGDPPSVIAGSIVNEKGELNLGEGQLGIMLVNIEEERILKSQLQRERRAEDNIAFSNPEIKLNLLILISANPAKDNYDAALAKLSRAIGYFQGTSYFDHTGFPDLDPGIEELIVDLYSLSMEQQNQLWASLGAKYLPSVVYRVRLVIIDSQLFGGDQKVIKVIDNNLSRIN